MMIPGYALLREVRAELMVNLEVVSILKNPPPV